MITFDWFLDSKFLKIELKYFWTNCNYVFDFFHGPNVAVRYGINKNEILKSKSIDKRQSTILATFYCIWFEMNHVIYIFQNIILMYVYKYINRMLKITTA